MRDASEGAHYGPQFAAIDEEIARLVAERDHLAEGRTVRPPAELIATWSDRFGLAPRRLEFLFGNLGNLPRVAALPPDPGELVAVLPVLRRVRVAGFTATLSHCLQHERVSVVHLEIAGDGGIQLGRPALALDVAPGGYQARPSGGHGSPGLIGLDFVVWPRLPDDLSAIGFTLRRDEEQERPAPVEPPLPIAFAPGGPEPRAES